MNIRPGIPDRQEALAVRQGEAMPGRISTMGFLMYVTENKAVTVLAAFIMVSIRVDMTARGNESADALISRAREQKPRCRVIIRMITQI